MKALILIGTALSSQLVLAHGDHKPPPKVAKCVTEICTKKEIADSAQTALQTVIQIDQKRKGWETAKFVELKEQQFKKEKEWVMTFTDETKSKGQQTIYVFVRPNGELNGSNFDGK